MDNEFADTPDQPLDSYDQLPPGLRASIADTPYEGRMREAAANGSIPEGFGRRTFLHVLGNPNALTDEDRRFMTWLENPPEAH